MAQLRIFWVCRRCGKVVENAVTTCPRCGAIRSITDHPSFKKASGG
jgi:rubrerythrin